MHTKAGEMTLQVPKLRSLPFKDGATTIGTGTISGSTATFAPSALSVSAHSITTIYGGDSNCTGSTNSVLTQTVNKATATIAVTSTLNPSSFGDTVTFNVTLTGAGGVTPTGPVALTTEPPLSERSEGPLYFAALLSVLESFIPSSKLHYPQSTKIKEP